MIYRVSYLYITVKVFFWTLSIVYISIKLRKLDLLPSSGKKGRTETVVVGPPG
jgi:hypothetical protein